jgi:hypothetical protein
MAEEQLNISDRPNEISPQGHRFVILWAAGLLLLYALGGYFGANLLRGYAAETARVRQANIEALTTGADSPTPAAGALSSAKPVDVRVRLSMNRIGEFDMKESVWTGDFALSFRWTGDAVNPGKDFRIVNGQITQREMEKSYERGGERFEEYRVVAQMTKPFDASRFPFGDEGLLVQVEDATHGLDSLRYVADVQNSRVGSESIPRIMKLARTLAGVQVRSSGPGLSDPAGPRSDTEAYSRFFFAMLIAPNSLGIYQRMFQALFASVAVSLIALYIKVNSIDCRFGLPVGGFFASVSNNIFVATLMPHADRITLTDMINTISMLTIFLVLVQSVISLYIFDNMSRQRLSQFFDRVSLAVFLPAYLVINLILPFAARPL